MNKKNIKILSKFLQIFLVLSIITSFCAPFYDISAATSRCASIKDLYKRKQCYSDEAAAASKLAEQKKQEKAYVETQIGQYTDKINQTQEDMIKTQSTIEQTQTSITELSKKIEDEEESLKKEKEKSNTVLSSWYMEGESGFFEAIISANNISEVVDSQQYYDSVKQQIKNSIEIIQSIKDELLNQKNTQERELVTLNSLKEGQVFQQKTLETQKSIKNTLLTNTTKAISDLNALEKEALENENKAAGEIKDAERRAATGSNWTRTGSSAQGFSWPISGSVGCGFGYSSCYFSGVFHTGIDIRAAVGTPVYATKAGSVVDTRSGMGNTYPSNKSYGNMIKIEHEGGVSTLYGHLSAVLVGLGSVSKGELIGYSGNSGYSTGAHLHFEMRDPNGVAVDPAPSLP